ncbi:hypothetical protein ACFQ1S_02785 [Kibdelosporangium lantanae]|uniref:Uncharacterized protein n=1 Tax=Kibdelosporangium lantanae TaxID=1497396 RepID=A0ABW3M3A4_9PSEU
MQVKLVTPLPDQLVKPGTEPNVLVTGRPVGDDPMAVFAATFGCPPVKPADSSVVPAGNMLGFCDQTLQPTIEAGLTGTKSLNEVIPVLEPQVWRQSVVLPLFQLADSVAIRTELSVRQPTAPLNAPFATAVTWQRNPK